MAKKEADVVEYVKVFVPRNNTEIVPSRKTRESENSLLQAHDGLGDILSKRSSVVSSRSSSPLPRKFDYAKLAFSPSVDGLSSYLKSEPKMEYINLIENYRRHTLISSDIEQPLHQRETTSYINIGVAKPSQIQQRRSSARSAETRKSPQPISRWQSVRAPRPGELRQAVIKPNDYQNLHYCTVDNEKAVMSYPLQPVIVNDSDQTPRNRSLQSSPSLQRNPNTGEYQNPLQLVAQESAETFSRSGSRKQTEHSRTQRTESQSSTITSQVDYQNLDYNAGTPTIFISEEDTHDSDYYSLHEEAVCPDAELQRQRSTSLIVGDYFNHLSPCKRTMDYENSIMLEQSISLSTSLQDTLSASMELNGYELDRTSLTDSDTFQMSPKIGYSNVYNLQSSAHSSSLNTSRSYNALSEEIPDLPKSDKKESPSQSGDSVKASHFGLFKLQYLGKCAFDK